MNIVGRKKGVVFPALDNWHRLFPSLTWQTHESYQFGAGALSTRIITEFARTEKISATKNTNNIQSTSTCVVLWANTRRIYWKMNFCAWFKVMSKNSKWKLKNFYFWKFEKLIFFGNFHIFLCTNSPRKKPTISLTKIFLFAWMMNQKALTLSETSFIFVKHHFIFETAINLDIYNLKEFLKKFILFLILRYKHSLSIPSCFSLPILQRRRIVFKNLGNWNW